MIDSRENPLVCKEIENFKFNVLTAALGLAAIVGSLAIPNHSQELEDLRITLEVAGGVMIYKGGFQMLGASDRVDELEGRVPGHRS